MLESPGFVPGLLVFLRVESVLGSGVRPHSNKPILWTGFRAKPGFERYGFADALTGYKHKKVPQRAGSLLGGTRYK